MQSYDLSGIRILSLDDNELDHIILGKLLKDTGVSLDTVLTPDEAISAIEKNRYDLILIDHMLPECDGITVLRRIRERHLCDDTPLIAVTGNNIASAKVSYLEAGFCGYIAKPISKAAMLDSFTHCLGLDKKNVTDKRRSILVVDDNHMNLVVSKKILSESYDVATAVSGEDAMEYLRTATPDMILLDLHMPGMDGFEFMERAKQDERLCDIPIICLTADDDHESEARCFELGAMDFITKPFIAEIMRKRVSRIMELNDLRRSLEHEVDKKTLEIKKNSRKLQRLTTQVMLTLASTIDAKDKYTNGHSLRVAEYSRMIVERLNMSEQEQENIYYIGLLHDIGKIGVPDEIINKTSRLTDEEYAIIKTHPTIGGEILEKMSELPDIAIGAKYHHERYDGKGYPEGLKGEDIPLVARIIGVADAYDAMTSNRSYRDVLPQAVVRGEIEKGIGTQFDPIFAEMMLKLIDEDTEYRMKEHK